MELIINAEQLIRDLKQFQKLLDLEIALFDKNNNCLLQVSTNTLLVNLFSEASSNCSSPKLIKQDGKLFVFLPVNESSSLIGCFLLGPFFCEAIPSAQQRKLDLEFFSNGSIMLHNNDHVAFSSDSLAAFVKTIEMYTEHAVLKGYIRGKSSEEFLRIEEYINDNLRNDLSAANICKDLLLPKNMLYQIVRQDSGMSLGNFVKYHRLDHAKALLKKTNESVTSIAELCGINDFSYFSRLFKQDTGITPLQYRKNSS